jgi:hypothetical protein
MDLISISIVFVVIVIMIYIGFSLNNKMVKTIDVDGFDALVAKLAQLSADGKSDNSVLILFCGSNDASGKSWCPDCVTGKLCG